MRIISVGILAACLVLMFIGQRKSLTVEEAFSTYQEVCEKTTGYEYKAHRDSKNAIVAAECTPIKQ